MEIVSAAYLLPMTSGLPVIRDGAIVVENGFILDVGKQSDLTKRFPHATKKPHSREVLLPGLVNAHCHLDMISFCERTFLESDFASPLHDFIPTLTAMLEWKKKMVSEKTIASFQRGIARLLDTGTTCVGDVTSFEGSFRLFHEMGIRAVIFPEIFGGGTDDAQSRYEVALALLEKYADASNDRIRFGLAPAAPYLLSRNLLKIIAAHAREAMIPVQIHAAESFAEMEFFFDSQGPIATELFPSLGWSSLPPPHHKTPIQFLEGIGFFEAPIAIVGGLHLSHNDFSVLARNMVRIITSPVANRSLKHGSLPLGRLAESGIPVGLGTELWNSRLGFSLWDEMRQALKGGSAPLATAKELLTMATLGGAKALSLDHLIGTLEKGKRADYITLTASPFTTDNECYEALVTTTQPQHITNVVVDGKTLKGKV